MALQQQQIAGRQQPRVADVEVFAAANAEWPRRLAADQEGRDVALRVEAALGDRDQRSRHGLAFRHHDERLDPLVVGQFARASRQLKRLTERKRKALGEVEAQDLIDALDTDIDQRTVERERLGVEPAARRDRLAIGPEHRRGLDIVEPGHLAALVDDAAGEPASLVADGDEALALRIQPQAGQSAEAAKPRGQDEPAAKFERAEPHARAVAGVERRNRPGIDVDRNRRADRVLVRRGLLRPRLDSRLSPHDAGRRSQ